MGRLPQKAETHPRQINNENYQRATATVEPTTKSSLFEVPLTHRFALCSIAPLNGSGISVSAERPNWNPMSEMGHSRQFRGPRHVRYSPIVAIISRCNK